MDQRQLLVPKHIRILQEKYKAMTAINSRFSLRSFAKKTGLDPGSFNLILRNKRPLSLKNAHKILPVLALSPQEQAEFLQSVLNYQKQSRLESIERLFGACETAIEVQVTGSISIA